MNYAIHDMVAVITASLTMMLIFLYLYANERHSYLKIWTYSWFFNVLRYFVSAVNIVRGGHHVLVFLELYFTVIAGFLFIWGAYNLLDKKDVKKIFVMTAFAVLFLLYAFLTGLQPVFINIVVFFIVMLAYIYVGVIILRNNVYEGFGKNITGVLFLLWGILNGADPFLSTQEYFEPLGYQLTVFFTFAASMGIILMHLEKSKRMERSRAELLEKIGSSVNSVYYSFSIGHEMKIEYLSSMAGELMGFTGNKVTDNGIIRKICGEAKTEPSKGNIKERAVPFRGNNGNLNWLELYSIPEYDPAGRMICLTGFAVDVSRDYIKLQEMLNRMEWYEGMFLLSGLPMVLLNKNTGVIEDVNFAAENFFGTGRDELKKKELKSFIFFDESIFEDILSFLSTQDSFTGACRLDTSAGVKDVILFSANVRFQGLEYVFMHILDKSTEKHLENRLFSLESVHSALLNAMDEGVILFNNSYEIVFANDSALSILGYSKDEMSGFMHNLLHKNSCGEDLDGNECVIIHSVENNSSLHNGETYFFDKSGNKIPVAFNINRISGCSYSSGGILVFRDITGEKISKDRLLKSIEENKLLIKEIHHRVKNNLQIVSSLLSIQSGYLDNQKAVDYFNNSIQRIKSMALIHEMLYKGDQIKGLDFKQYISRLVNEISHSYANTFPIATEMNCENISISLDESVSLSLIMTEIVTNSFKHAFTEDMQNPRITINVFLDENGKRNIVIADNGKGFSDTNSFYTSGNLGAQIIQSLIEQIGGSLDLKNEGGAEFILKF